MNLLNLIIRHFSWLPKLGAVLGRQQSRFAFALVAFGALEAIVEMLSIGSIVPLLALAADPNSSASLAVLNRLARWTGPIQPHEALVGISLAVLTALAMQAVVRWTATKLRNRFSIRVRNSTAERLLSIYVKESYERQLRADPNRRLAMVTGDSVNISSLASETIVIAGAIMQVIALTAMMLLIDWRVTMASIALVAILGATSYLLLFRRLRALGHEAMDARLSATATAARLLQGYREAAIYDRDAAGHREFTGDTRRMGGALEKVGMLRQSPVIFFEWLVGSGVVVGLLVLSLQDNFSSVLPLAVAFAAAALRLVPAAIRAISNAAQLRFHLASLDAVHRDIVSQNTDRNPSDDLQSITFREIRFKDVSFSYGGASTPALTDVNAHIPHGTMLGVCGPSGSGKSTFVNVLMGLLSPATGEVLVDGQPIRGRERAWQGRIALVPQDPFFWNGSIRDNLLFGRKFPHAEDRIRSAMEQAHIASFVGTLPKGIDTIIGDRGSRLSGGQRQRLAVARALLGEPELVVLDEPTSALDHEVALAIDEMLSELKGSKTLVVVAHRASSVVRCDQVLYLADGHIAGQGSFSSLAASNRGFADVFGLEWPDIEHDGAPRELLQRPHKSVIAS